MVIACADESDIEWAQSLISYADVIPQLPKYQQGNLGERLNYVDTKLRAKGHQQLIFIGTDAPILNSQHFVSALMALHDNDIVLSHADDGGVIIMANKTPWPELKTLPWSTDELSVALSQLCKQHRLSVKYSLPGYDVDYVADLQKLLLDLKTDKRPARQALLNKIKAFVY